MSVRTLYLCMIGYLYLPLLIFLTGWTVVFVSVPVIIASAAALYFSFRHIFKENKGSCICLSLTEILAVYVLFTVILVFAGQGDLFPQDFDWHKHHAIYRDLLNYSWPVVYGNDSMLTYYLGQYIVPAAVGKIFGKSYLAMDICIPLWNAAGLTLVYIFVSFYLHADSRMKKAGVIIAIIFWGGCTNLGQEVYKLMGHDVTDGLQENFKWIDRDRIRIHFASNYDALYGAFQHVISPWVSCCLFLGNRKHKEAYVAMALPLMFTATFGFVYFCVLLLFFVIFDFIRSDARGKTAKDIFSLGNLLLIPLTAVLFIYLAGNFFGDKPSDVGSGIVPMQHYIDFYIIFVLVEFVGYAVFLFPRNRKNILFYAITAELMLIPFISMGLYNDLCSRGSIPARFILMVLCIDQTFYGDRRGWATAGLTALLLTAALNTEVEIWNHLDKFIDGRHDPQAYIKDDYKSFEGYAGNIEKAGREDNAYNYFTLNYSESLFHKIARK